MKTRTWIIVFGILALAGVADAWTWALGSESVRGVDLSPAARLFASLPIAIFLGKAAAVAGLALVVWVARRRRLPSIEWEVALVSVGATALWCYGAYTNVSY